jgi:hypothetical protein
MSAEQDAEYDRLVHAKVAAIAADHTLDADRRFAAHWEAIISSHSAIYGSEETIKKLAGAMKIPT